MSALRYADAVTAPCDDDGDLLVAPAAARNQAAILAALHDLLPPGRGLRVLELAAGSGQHAAFFTAELLPRLASWLPTDASEAALRSIAAHRRRAPADMLRVLQPAQLLDVQTAQASALPPSAFDAVLAVNVLHISPPAATPALLRVAAAALRAGGRLVIYGPFRVSGAFTTESNAAFDAQLKGMDAAFGLRDVDEVAAAADACGLALDERRDMPSNNFILAFTRR